MTNKKRIFGTIILFIMTGVFLSFAVAKTLDQNAGKSSFDGESLVEMGRQIFFNETFAGNGRTCGTCHPAENNFTIDPQFIATLPPDNPLFVAEFDDNLKDLERPVLMRQFGLILENVDGFENQGLMRCVPHLFALNLTTQLLPGNVNDAGFADSTGWSGDGQPLLLPGGVTTRGSLREFTIGAIFQHFPKTLNRKPGVDFRLPTEQELDAIDAFMRSLGRQAEIDLAAMTFRSAVVEKGKVIFNAADRGKCFRCHLNAGAVNATNVNLNVNTGVEDLTELAHTLVDMDVARDGGFGVRDDGDGKGGLGDGTFSTPPLVEAADTPPFFHNNSINTIEAAVGFFNSQAFQDSTGGQAVGGIRLDASEVVAIASMLRTINALENIRQSNLNDRMVLDTKLASGRELLAASIADTEDAIEVLTGGQFELFDNAVDLLLEALIRVRQARQVGIGKRNQLLVEAINLRNQAKADILE